MQIRCTVTVVCVGCLTGWKVGIRNPASPAVQGHRAWRANCCSPRQAIASNAQVLYKHRENLFMVKNRFWAISCSPGPVDPSVSDKCSPCALNPCLNQGRCHTDPVHLYKCICPQGYKVKCISLNDTALTSVCVYSLSYFCCLYSSREKTARSLWTPVNAVHVWMEAPVIAKRQEKASGEKSCCYIQTATPEKKHRWERLLVSHQLYLSTGIWWSVLRGGRWWLCR